MKSTFFLLPALAAFCHGVAIPQSIVTGVTMSVPEQTYTIVIPCFPGQVSCAPRTVTLDARDPEPQSLGSVSRSASVPPTLPTTTTTTSKSKTHHYPPRQTLVGSPSRSVPVWPYSTVTVVTTVTVTATPSSSISTPLSTTTKATTSSSVASSSSTTSIIKTSAPTTLVTTTTTSDSSIRSVNTDQGSSSIYSINTADTSGVLTVRQVLGSPTRTVLEWPYPTVVTKTITKTVTATYVPPPTSVVSVTTPQPTTSTTSAVIFPSDTSAILPVLTVPVDKNRRQVLGKPTRSVSWY